MTAVERGRGRLPRWWAPGAAGVLILAAIGWLLLARRPETAPPTAFPPPPDSASPAVRFADFAGSDRCAECHAEKHAAWAASTHGNAGQAPPGGLVLLPFDGTPIRLRDATVEPRRDGETWEFVVRWADRVDRYPVVGVIGAAHMVGGGTQGFVWRHPDGSLRLLPFEIAGDDRAWFCSTGSRGQRGWVRITADMSIADCHDWPPIRALGSLPRFESCQECHGSRIQPAPAGRPYETRFASLSIDCESCHGPGRLHADAMRAGSQEPAAAMRPHAPLSRDESVAVCMRCHALKVAVRPGDLPGAPLEERYSLKLPLLGGDEVHPDGRTRAFAYQQGHYYSDCYLSGSMTCVDCHEPHGQAYRDIAGQALAGRFDDAQCTSCHPSKAEQPEHHTMHPPRSEGSRCVACHMPFVQQAAVGPAIRYARSDHTISIPRPLLDQRLGIENACRACHADRSSDDLDREIERLWGPVKPLRPIIAALLRNPGRSDLERILLDADTTHRFAYFDALARHFATLDRVDGDALPRRVRNRLWQLAQSADDDLAALALATLHLDGGHRTATRAALAGRLRALGSRDPAVRRRWAIALGHRADDSRARGRTADAIALYGKALELLPDDPPFLLALALARLETRDTATATALLGRLVAIEPRNSLAWINSGLARAAAGDAPGAREAFRHATSVNPFDGLAFFHLGNALIAEGSRAEAEAAWRHAAELDPSLAPAHFNLARVLLLQGRQEQALAPLRAGLLFDPDNREARAAAAQLEAILRQAGRPR